jgi:DNA-binding transcriptional MerR regulator
MSATYSTKEASELTGVSRQALRVYTRRYARYLSTEATPDQGQERRFTLSDLRLVAFVYGQTSAGASHESVAERLAAGALDNFEWQPEQSTEGHSASETPEGALIPVERLQAAFELLQDAQQREQDALEQAAAAKAEITRLTLELGKAQGEAETLKASRYRAPAWWRAIFGGSGE